MAIEKGVYQAPEGLDDFEDMMEEGPDMSVTVVNPEILEFGRAFFAFLEGCLSFPNLVCQVERPCSVTAKFLNAEGKEITADFVDGEAAKFLHEFDHLYGVFFVDRAYNRTSRRLFEKAKKIKLYHRDPNSYGKDNG